MAGSFSIDGLVSGLNTTDIISKLISIEQQPIQIVRGKVSKEAARLKSVNAIKSQITSLQATINSLVTRGAINVKSAVTDAAFGAPPILTATATSDAASGSFKVTVSQLATSTQMASATTIGKAIDRNATLGTAGFRLSPIVSNSTGGAATFTINGATVSVDNTTTFDDGTANSLLSKINASAAGVTASLVNDSDGRPNNRIQVISSAGQSLRVGSLGDTSNVLRLLSLADATAEGYTASNITSTAADAGALSTSVTINGVTTAINQSNGSFDAVQNAQFIADALNGSSSNTVTATALGDGTIRLAQKSLGSQATINISSAGSGTGLTVGVTKNGTDRILGTLSLGATDVGKALADSRLITPITGLDSSGSGSFNINGVDISYRATDTISSIITRINAPTVGVNAFYDSVQDKIRLTANQSGARTITLSDTTGNFLAATGIVSASQTLGQNAIYRIDSVNGGETLTSASNKITGIVPGITLDLKSTSATPVTVTVSQNNQAAVDIVKQFVNRVNQVLDSIEAQTAYDPTNKSSQPLSGDAGVLGIAQNLRSLVNSPALGMTGSFKNLATIGVSTGSVGAKVGSTNRLTLDETKLTDAMNQNPQAVEALFSTFSVNYGATAGQGNVAAVSGTPLNQHVSGTYYVKVLDSAGKAEARLVGQDGKVIFSNSGTLVPGQDNSLLIPGVKITAASTLDVGEDSFAMTVSGRGVGIQLKDTVTNLLGTGGFFETRTASSSKLTTSLNSQIDTMQTRVTAKEAQLKAKFAALETAMARLQSQGNSLAASLARLG